MPFNFLFLLLMLGPSEQLEGDQFGGRKASHFAGEPSAGNVWQKRRCRWLHATARPVISTVVITEKGPLHKGTERFTG